MPKVENATELLAFRATPSERKAIEKAARKEGKRLSDYLRDRALEQKAQPSPPAG